MRLVWSTAMRLVWSAVCGGLSGVLGQTGPEPANAGVFGCGSLVVSGETVASEQNMSSVFLW